jgi:isocitrate dehydrogenase (NAD+)
LLGAFYHAFGGFSVAHAVTLLPGDGIGPEVSGATQQVIEASGVEIEWHEMEAGAAAIEKHGTQLPDHVVESIVRDGVALKGPLTTPIGTGFSSANVALRKRLDLYACLRPVSILPGVKTRFENVDLIVVRENTEGLYSGIEHEVVPGVVESLKITTERACRRISEFAFEHAKRNKRKRITAVHKANIMKMTDGLFLKCAREVAARYPETEYNEMIVDATCMWLVQDPLRFDILLCENLYGDLLSDLCAGLVGGLGVVPGANIGVNCAVFEAVHGSAPDIAGKGVANPTAMLLSGCMMLDHLGERAAADRIRSAVVKVLSERKTVTRDLGGTASTQEYATALVSALQGPGAVEGQ